VISKTGILLERVGGEVETGVPETNQIQSFSLSRSSYSAQFEIEISPHSVFCVTAEVETGNSGFLSVPVRARCKTNISLFVRLEA